MTAFSAQNIYGIAMTSNRKNVIEFGLMLQEQIIAHSIRVFDSRAKPNVGRPCVLPYQAFDATGIRDTESISTSSDRHLLR